MNLLAVAFSSQMLGCIVNLLMYLLGMLSFVMRLTTVSTVGADEIMGWGPCASNAVLVIGRAEMPQVRHFSRVLPFLPTSSYPRSRSSFPPFDSC